MRDRGTSITFLLAGVLFMLYPVLRPYSSERGIEGAEAFASPLWLIAHLSAIAGFMLLLVATARSLWPAIIEKRRRRDRAALALFLVGITGTLPYYGAETFALNAIGRRALAESDPALLSLADEVRGGVALFIFLAGLLALAAAAILFVGSPQSSRLGRWGSIALAVGLATFIPQFFGTPEIRIAHGAVIALGCLLLGVAAWVSPRRMLPQARQTELADLSA